MARRTTLDICPSPNSNRSTSGATLLNDETTLDTCLPKNTKCASSNDELSNPGPTNALLNRTNEGFSVMSIKLAHCYFNVTAYTESKDKDFNSDYVNLFSQNLQYIPTYSNKKLFLDDHAGKDRASSVPSSRK